MWVLEKEEKGGWRGFLKGFRVHIFGYFTLVINMLVELNLPRAILLLAGLCNMLVGGQTIILTNSFEDMRIGSDAGFTLDLYTMVYGPNLTFSISGNYAPSLPTSGISIVQNLYPSYTQIKTKQSNQQQKYGGLKVDFVRKLLYTLEGNNLNTWTLYNFPAITNNSAYEVTTKGTLLSMDISSFTMPGTEKLNYFASTIESQGNTYTLRVINCTDPLNMAEIVSLRTFRVETEFIRGIFTQNDNILWGFLYTTTWIDIFRFNVTGDLTGGYVYTVNAASIGVKAITPISLDFYAENGYYCDSTLGVFEFSLANLTNEVPTFPVVQELYAPLTIGEITSCVIENGLLTVDTLKGTAVYILPSLEQWKLYPYNSSYTELAVYGMTTNSDFTVGYVNTQTTKSTNTLSFRVFSTSMPYVNSILIDLGLNYLLQGDMSNTNPSFLLYQDFATASDYVIINGGINLIVYLIQPGSFLTFPGQAQAYNYTGTLSVTNGVITKSYPVSLNGVSANSTNIFANKGIYPGQGYATYSNYSSYVLATNQSQYYFYIPVDNYFTGTNVTYDLEIVQGIDTFDKLTVSLPAKSALMESTNVTSTPIVQPIIATYNSAKGSDIVAMISGNYIRVMMYNDYECTGVVNTTFDVNGMLPSMLVVTHTDLVYIIVESTGVNSLNQYVVLWTAYSVNFAVNDTSISTAGSWSFPNRPPSDKLEIYASRFFCLSGSTIEVYSLTALSGTVTMTLYTSISEANLDQSIGFNPVTFTVHFNLYVFDYIHGLISLEVSNANVHTITMYNLTLPITYNAQLESNLNYLMLLTKTSTTTGIYRIPFSTPTYYDMQPIVHCDIPISLSVSTQFYSVICAESAYFYMQIFEFNAQSYASLYTEIYPKSQGAFALGYETTSGKLAGYFTNGELFNCFSIGQIGDSNWNPTYPVSYIPTTDQSLTTWARLEVQFTDTIFSPFYDLIFKLVASNIYMSMNENIYISLYNSADYIDVNTTYSPSLSNFTSGEILLSQGSFSSPLPLEAFNGNDIELAFQINSTIGYIIPATETCIDSSKLFCLENKTHEYMTVGTYVYDYDMTGDFLVTTNSTNISTFNITGNSSQLFNVLSDTVLGTGTSCFNVRFLPGLESFVISCSTINSLGDFYFLDVVHPTQGKCSSSSFTLSYPTTWMRVEMDASGIIWIYQFEGTTISILNLVFTPSTSVPCACAFKLISTITQNSLLVNTFAAVNFAMINSTNALIGEASSGLLFLNVNVASTQTTFTLNSTYRPTNNALQSSVSKLSSMSLLSDKDTVLLVMSTADVYKISISSLSTLMHFPKILLNGAVPTKQIPGLDESATMLAYPVFVPGAYGVIRILNYTDDQYSAIFKDRVLNIMTATRYYGRVMFGNSEITMMHNMSPSQSTAIDRPVHMIAVRKAPMGYVYKSEQNYNGTVALVGYSKGQVVQYSPVSYYYPGKVTPAEAADTANYYRSYWNKWYFWTILAFTSLVLFTSLMAVYVCIAKRKERTSSTLSIGLTTVNP